jgi:D-beta-D-heptose 7-phosphate kinase/D-beta-D-heptose 1-phosphate adenosyltransferase
MALVSVDDVQHIPATAREVFDVSGAGDTVIATLAVGLAGGLTINDAVRLANLAAGHVVARLGTVPVHRTDLLRLVLEESKGPSTGRIFQLEELVDQVQVWRSRGERIVFTNGCFDILHAGHVAYLEHLKREGDRLIVGLNSDNSVRRLKGRGRPINRQEDRARILAALSCVDAVVVFEEDTPLELIRRIRPDIVGKGGDYDESQIVGSDEVKSWGGRVVIAPLLDGRSTSAIVRRIRDDVSTDGRATANPESPNPAETFSPRSYMGPQDN